ncbi:LprG protein [Mycolicibacterium farcinogenes]|jgi:lipoprotein LprG|uniref:LprG protein n=4 Tax=Mycolicibacterium TaxID=1866885 RepID=A0A378T4H5_9MYCO|nr:LprG protein [Mycolicibacterium farcinogenes]CQD14153.1 LprG protein [Mycolicibacterium conceptionense]STZ54805.1 LprG protein [Mycolicibacterium senegalense]
MQVMQTRPRFAVQSLLAILFAAAALVAGCSSSSEKSNAPLPDAAELLQQSAATTKAQQSVHLLLTVEGTIKGLPVEKLDGDLTNTPAVAAQGTVDLNAFGQKISDAKFVVADGTLYAALTAGDPLSDYGPAEKIYDVSTILNPDLGLANVLANFTDPKAEGRESINGTEGVRVTGTVSAEAVNKIAPQLKAEGPVPGTAWISEDGDHALLQAKLEPTPGNSVTMTLTDWGKQVTVTKPAS